MSKTSQFSLFTHRNIARFNMRAIKQFKAIICESVPYHYKHVTLYTVGLFQLQNFLLFRNFVGRLWQKSCWIRLPGM